MQATLQLRGIRTDTDDRSILLGFLRKPPGLWVAAKVADKASKIISADELVERNDILQFRVIDLGFEVEAPAPPEDEKARLTAELDVIKKQLKAALGSKTAETVAKAGNKTAEKVDSPEHEHVGEQEEKTTLLVAKIKGEGLRT